MAKKYEIPMVRVIVKSSDASLDYQIPRSEAVKLYHAGKIARNEESSKGDDWVYEELDNTPDDIPGKIR